MDRWFSPPRSGATSTSSFDSSDDALKRSVLTLTFARDASLAAVQDQLLRRQFLDDGREGLLRIRNLQRLPGYAIAKRGGLARVVEGDAETPICLEAVLRRAAGRP